MPTTRLQAYEALSVLDPPFVLIHSPHVGPLTWQLVADSLRNRGARVVTPGLSHSGEDADRPFWVRHAREVVEAIEASGFPDPPVVVGHSGAGPLLPAIRPCIRGTVRGYVFVDCLLPRDGASRIDLLDDQRAATLFRAAASDRLLLTWSYEELRALIPDDALRRRFVGQLDPAPLPIYEEPLPAFEGWPDAPCAYLMLSGIYSGAARQARDAGWPTIELDAGHYHMLVDPDRVAGALIRLVRSWDGPDGRIGDQASSPGGITAQAALEVMLSPFRRLKR